MCSFSHVLSEVSSGCQVVPDNLFLGKIYRGKVIMLWFKKKKEKKKEYTGKPDRGLLIFAHPTTVISVQELLRDEGYDIRVVSPPPTYRTGCDLSVEFPFDAESAIVELLHRVGLSPMDVVPITSKGTEPLQFVRVKDFGRYLMVRAANMKITVDKESREIVNISGGGCPDVPFLATCMLGKRLREAPDPGEVGFSLCAYSLNMAREEMIRLIGD